MSTGFADVHDELRAVARDLLGAASPQAGDGGPPAPTDWAQLADLGWLGLEVPEPQGGAGATFAELAVVLEEMGRAATVGPVLGGVVLGGACLTMLRASPERDDLLRRLASGDARLGVALSDGADERVTAPPAFVLQRGPSGLRLRGRARFVPDAAEADRLLLLAMDDGVPVVVAVAPDHPGIAVVPEALLDATRAVATVTTDAEVQAAQVWRFAGQPESSVGRLGNHAAVAVACDSLGLSRAMLDATVAYAGVRTQFGRAIGSFQAVKHTCADMLVQIAVCEELVAAAVAAILRDDPDAWVAAAMAKAHVTDAAVGIVGDALQLHGGIGYTWESGIHVYLKRAVLNRSLFGSPTAHRRRLGRRLAEASLAPRPADA